VAIVDVSTVSQAKPRGTAIVPVTRTKGAARANYDQRSRHYACLEGRLEGSCHDAGIRLLAVSAGESVLEIGYGPGLALVEFARAAGHAGSVVGIDISTRMRDIAAQRIAHAGLSDRVDLRVGDASSLPFANESFDAVFMSFTLELFDTPELGVVLGECRRVLRPGGRLGVVALALADWPRLATRIYIWFHRRLPRLVDCRPIPAADLVRAAGFTDLHWARRSLWTLPIDVVVARTPAAPAAAERHPDAEDQDRDSSVVTRDQGGTDEAIAGRH
jgi:ubiquinone/menaquinone biosynthesis C-methylase UbiE